MIFQPPKSSLPYRIYQAWFLLQHFKLLDNEVDFPRFPLFHRPTLLLKVATRAYLHDKALFAAVMSICALASARARDGALFPGRWDPSYFRHPASESFSAAARDVTPRLNLGAMKGIHWMQTCALLALLGIQNGKIDLMHQYIGLYHTLVAMDALHDEKNWPKDIGIVEFEERRRLVRAPLHIHVQRTFSK